MSILLLACAAQPMAEYQRIADVPNRVTSKIVLPFDTTSFKKTGFVSLIGMSACH
jgi:hypothetical protein